MNGTASTGGKNNAPLQSWELNESLMRPLVICGLDAEPLRGPHQLGYGNQSHLLGHPHSMNLDRHFTDVEVGGYLLVELARNDVPQHFQFSRCQPFDPRSETRERLNVGTIAFAFRQCDIDAARISS
jgi:hypothetical protein